MKSIPIHEKCVNCGGCCGPVHVSDEEINAIKAYTRAFFSKAYTKKLREMDRGVFECQFRDTEKKICAIYPVRPLICRLFGVAKGLECPQGNSAHIDGFEVLGNTPRRPMPKIL